MQITQRRHQRHKCYFILTIFALFLLMAPFSGSAAENNTVQNLAEFYYQKGTNLLQARQYESALIHFKRAIALDKSAGRYFSAKAETLLGLGKQKEALLNYQQAIKLDPENKDIQQGLKKISGQQVIKTGVTKSMTKIDANGEKGPSSMVKHNNFFIDRMEVSVGQFQSAFPEYQIPNGFTPVMPVVNISYEQAVEYAKRKNKRLCTSEEWQVVLNEYGDGDIRQNNLYKDYHGGPYPVDNGTGEVKNLLGNVAEWVGDNPDRPGYIGGHWFSATLLQDSLEQATQVISTEGGAPKPFVGFRCCRDVW